MAAAVLMIISPLLNAAALVEWVSPYTDSFLCVSAGVSGPVRPGGAVLSQLPRHTQLLLLRRRFRLLPRPLSGRALPSQVPAHQRRHKNMSPFNVLQTHHTQTTPPVLHKSDRLSPTVHFDPPRTVRCLKTPGGAPAGLWERAEGGWDSASVLLFRKETEVCEAQVLSFFFFVWKHTLARTKTRDQALKKRTRTAEKWQFPRARLFVFFCFFFSLCWNSLPILPSFRCLAFQESVFPSEMKRSRTLKRLKSKTKRRK